MKTETEKIETVRSFLGNEAFVLAGIAADPESTMRALADKTGMTERNVQRIVAILVREGYVNAKREGRRNYYSINATKALPHAMEAGLTVGSLLRLFRPKKEK